MKQPRRSEGNAGFRLTTSAGKENKESLPDPSGFAPHRSLCISAVAAAWAHANAVNAWPEDAGFAKESGLANVLGEETTRNVLPWQAVQPLFLAKQTADLEVDHTKVDRLVLHGVQVVL